MFSQACVNYSVHIRGEVYTPQADTPCQADTLLGRHPTTTQTHPLSSRHPPARQTTPPGRHPPWVDTPPHARQTPPRHPPRDGYCSGRYASYWNAFLFVMVSFLTSFRGLTCGVISIPWRDTIVLTFASDQKKFTSVLTQNTRRCRTQKVFIIKSTRKTFQF